jgi:hypothetical protein
MADRTNRWLDQMPLAEIGEAERNPKAHAADSIARSIARFGYVEPMVLDERTGRLVAGHGRLADLRRREAAGEDPPEGVVLDGARWLAPVMRGWSSRSDAEAEAAGIALNRIGEVGGWESDLLTELLGELRDLDPELLEATGFLGDDLEELLAVHGQAPSLDKLEAEHGSFGERDDWAKVTIMAPQHVAAAWTRYASTFEHEGDALGALLGDLVGAPDDLAAHLEAVGDLD